ncbi:MAG: VUT family protein [Lachnospiraceae bacterium]|nr:VUT family protein [Lachnospiraceae bacterium]
MSSIQNKIKDLILEIKVLQRSIPSMVMAMFSVSLVAMNLLANKSVNIASEYVAVDTGILFSWIVFLLMDMMVKRFGPRAATLTSFMALLINLGLVLMLFLAGQIPGMWGEAYVDGAEDLINGALNRTFGGTWYVLLGSSVAFMLSAVVNNALNWAILQLRRGSLEAKAKNTNLVVNGNLSEAENKNEMKASLQEEKYRHFAMRSFISTFVSQFVDNLTFALIVSLNFFGWTLTQCIGCAFTGAILELLCEVIFSPIGYRVAKKWDAENVGSEYIERYLS